jgi:hypothetical protein
VRKPHRISQETPLVETAKIHPLLAKSCQQPNNKNKDTDFIKKITKMGVPVDCVIYRTNENSFFTSTYCREKHVTATLLKIGVFSYFCFVGFPLENKTK